VAGGVGVSATIIVLACLLMCPLVMLGMMWAMRRGKRNGDAP
jgi:hypothetical protein